MWCCDCCGWLTGAQPGERAPLISGQRVPPGGQNVAAAPSVNRHRVDYNGPNSGPELPYSSVRDGFFPAVMKEVKVSSVDKRLQDHAKLFNIHLELWARLNEKVEELRKMFSEENHKSTLNGTFAYLHKVCKNYSSFSVTRPYAYCLEIIYDGREIPHSIIPAFISFNLANRTIKEILDKGPSLKRSVRMVLDNSKELRREVLVASLGPGMADALTNCHENLETLEIVITRVDEVEAQTKKIFDEFLTFQADFQNLSV